MACRTSPSQWPRNWAVPHQTIRSARLRFGPDDDPTSTGNFLVQQQARAGAYEFSGRPARLDGVEPRVAEDQAERGLLQPQAPERDVSPDQLSVSVRQDPQLLRRGTARCLLRHARRADQPLLAVESKERRAIRPALEQFGHAPGGHIGWDGLDAHRAPGDDTEAGEPDRSADDHHPEDPRDAHAPILCLCPLPPAPECTAVAGSWHERRIPALAGLSARRLDPPGWSGRLVRPGHSSVAEPPPVAPAPTSTSQPLPGPGLLGWGSPQACHLQAARAQYP